MLKRCRAIAFAAMPLGQRPPMLMMLQIGKMTPSATAASPLHGLSPLRYLIFRSIYLSRADFQDSRRRFHSALAIALSHEITAALTTSSCHALPMRMPASRRNSYSSRRGQLISYRASFEDTYYSRACHRWLSNAAYYAAGWLADFRAPRALSAISWRWRVICPALYRLLIPLSPDVISVLTI